MPSNNDVLTGEVCLKHFYEIFTNDKHPLFSRLTFKGVMTRSMVDALSESCSPFLKGGSSAFIAAIASGLFPQNEYRSLE